MLCVPLCQNAAGVSRCPERGHGRLESRVSSVGWGMIDNALGVLFISLILRLAMVVIFLGTIE